MESQEELNKLALQLYKDRRQGKPDARYSSFREQADEILEKASKNQMSETEELSYFRSKYVNDLGIKFKDEKSELNFYRELDGSGYFKNSVPIFLLILIPTLALLSVLAFAYGYIYFLH
jgi:hypothetical protein